MRKLVISGLALMATLAVSPVMAAMDAGAIKAMVAQDLNNHMSVADIMKAVKAKDGTVGLASAVTALVKSGQNLNAVVASAIQDGANAQAVVNAAALGGASSTDVMKAAVLAGVDPSTITPPSGFGGLGRDGGNRGDNRGDNQGDNRVARGFGGDLPGVAPVPNGGGGGVPNSRS